jgi:hypothetical protein
MDNHRDYVWENVIKTYSFDSTCFRRTIVTSHGFGHFLNTCHPKSSINSQKEANCEFIVTAEGYLIIVALIDLINPGDELLCDYHWQLAVLDEAGDDNKNIKIRTAIELGKKCKCSKCKSARALHEKFLLPRKRKLDLEEEERIWPDASSEVHQQLSFLYLKAYCLQFNYTQIEEGAPIVIEPGDFLNFGAGITEQSWRNLLDKIPVELIVKGGFVQISAHFGIQALLAAFYCPNLEYSISVVPTHREAQVSLATFKDFILKEKHILNSGVDGITISPSPATSTSSDNCDWKAIDGTILLISSSTVSSDSCAKLGMEAFNSMRNLGVVITNFSQVKDRILHFSSTWMLSDTVKCLSSSSAGWSTFFILTKTVQSSPANVSNMVACLLNFGAKEDASLLQCNHKNPVEVVHKVNRIKRLGYFLMNEIIGGFALNLRLFRAQEVDGVLYRPYIIFFGCQTQHTCILRGVEGTWYRANENYTCTQIDKFGVSNLAKTCQYLLLLSIEASLVENIQPCLPVGIPNPENYPTSYIYCVFLLFKSLIHLYRPKSLEMSSCKGRIWSLFRLCMLETKVEVLQRLFFQIHCLIERNFIEVKNPLHFIDLFMTHVMLDFQPVPVAVSKSLNFYNAGVEHCFSHSWESQTCEMTEKNIPLPESVRPGLNFSELEVGRGLKITSSPLKRIRGPRATTFSENKGLCLQMSDISIDSTRAERELVELGYSILEHQFIFREKDVKDLISAFEKSHDKIKPIRNTAEDLDAGNHWNIPGVTAPRSMLFEAEIYQDNELLLIKQVKNALRNEPALNWLTQKRTSVNYTILRSQPGLSRQFWHRDYCLKHLKNKRMPARTVPLFLIVAFQKDTSLDFPTGRFFIPMGRICVVRGDMIHRGVENALYKFCHYRLHITIEISRMIKFREDTTGEAEFEPASIIESKEYDEAYESAMLLRLRNRRKGVGALQHRILRENDSRDQKD